MKPSEMIPFLADAYKHRMQVLVKGPPGCGKSDVIDSAIQITGAMGITRHPQVEDPIDSKGMPCTITENGEKTAVFLPFKEFAALLNRPSLTVVHLEDLGQTPPAVRKAYMQLLLRRELNGKKISPNVVFTASSNEAGQGCGVDGVEESIKSRFATIVPLTVCFEDWTVWAIDHNMPPWLISFVRNHPKCLEDWKVTKEMTNSSCSRTVANVGLWANINWHNLEVWAGAVGAGWASEMMAYYKGTQIPDAEHCIANPMTAEVPPSGSLRYATVAAVSYHTTVQNFAKALRYIQRMDRAMEILFLQRTFKRTPEITGTPEFGRWAVDPVNREIVFG